MAKIVEKVKALTNVSQWRNTDFVLTWFKGHNKLKLSFMSFDIVNLYPSISEDLLKRGSSYFFCQKVVPSNQKSLHGGPSFLLLFICVRLDPNIITPNYP